MSLTSTTIHHHSLCPRFRHARTRSGQTEVLAIGAPGRRSEQRHCSADSISLAETGSAVVEGIAAVAIAFILFTVVAQLSIALLAHQVAEAAVASAARQASLRPGFSEEQLMADLRATVPGAGRIQAGLVADAQLSRAWATFEFLPPGPMFRSFEFSVEAEVPVVVAP